MSRQLPLPGFPPADLFQLSAYLSVSYFDLLDVSIVLIVGDEAPDASKREASRFLRSIGSASRVAILRFFLDGLDGFARREVVSRFYSVLRYTGE